MAEYIEREAVNDLIKAECSPKVAAYLIDAVATVPAADVRPAKWIPVTERLPERFKSVLTVDKYGVITFNWISGDGKNWSTGYHITHWMPLPQPPKEE